MDYLYSIKRKVVRGRSRGRVLGFPTANLRYYGRDELLEEGVYVIFAKIRGKKCKGLGHIGRPKTFDGRNRKIEIYLLNCNKSLYGKELEVNFVERIRISRKFKNKDALIAQIKKDCEKVKKYNIK
jgi:riboflavin kinase/FMN adenylyltransferase